MLPLSDMEESMMFPFNAFMSLTSDGDVSGTKGGVKKPLSCATSMGVWRLPEMLDYPAVKDDNAFVRIVLLQQSWRRYFLRATEIA